MPRFRERVFVVVVDGEVVASDNFTNILLDLAVLRSLSVKVVLVHGASYQIEQLAKERGARHYEFRWHRRDRRRHSGGEHRRRHPADQRNHGGSFRGGSAGGLHERDIAHPAGILGGQDYEYTGRVERVDVKALRLLLDEGIVPIIPPLGFDGEGRTYRVNSDAAAVEVAEELSAAKIIYLAPGSAFSATVPHQLSVPETQDLLKKRRAEFSASVISKVRMPLGPVSRGSSVHLLDGGR